MNQNKVLKRRYNYCTRKELPILIKIRVSKTKQHIVFITPKRQQLKLQGQTKCFNVITTDSKCDTTRKGTVLSQDRECCIAPQQDIQVHDEHKQDISQGQEIDVAVLNEMDVENI